MALTAATGAAVRTGDARAAAAAPTIGVIQTPNFTRARRSAGISQVVIHVLLSDGQVVAHAGTAHRVDWDSSTTPNGAHELELRATALDGRTATRTFSVLVANEDIFAEPAPRVLWQSMSDWQTVRRSVAWQALIEGTVQQVEFWVDGRVRSIAVRQPYSFGEGGLWDASSLRPGPHDLAVRAVGTGGRIAESRALVFVAKTP